VSQIGRATFQPCLLNLLDLCPRVCVHGACLATAANIWPWRLALNAAQEYEDASEAQGQPHASICASPGYGCNDAADPSLRKTAGREAPWILRFWVPIVYMSIPSVRMINVNQIPNHKRSAFPTRCNTSPQLHCIALRCSKYMVAVACTARRSAKAAPCQHLRKRRLRLKHAETLQLTLA
jgi:hypothetical protein